MPQVKFKYLGQTVVCEDKQVRRKMAEILRQKRAQEQQEVADGETAELRACESFTLLVEGIFSVLYDNSGQYFTIWTDSDRNKMSPYHCMCLPAEKGERFRYRISGYGGSAVLAGHHVTGVIEDGIGRTIAVRISDTDGNSWFVAVGVAGGQVRWVQLPVRIQSLLIEAAAKKQKEKGRGK